MKLMKTVAEVHSSSERLHLHEVLKEILAALSATTIPFASK